jgi:metal-dependent amidase/aminoacylase/carboxypeptidase family protein
MAIASITQFNTFIQADISKENYCLITPIYTTMGKKAYGVSGSWRNSFTVRSDSNGKMRTIETTLEHIAHEVADEYRLSVT